MDGANTGITRYQNGLGIDDKLKLTNGGASKYFLADHLDSIVAQEYLVYARSLERFTLGVSPIADHSSRRCRC